MSSYFDLIPAFQDNYILCPQRDQAANVVDMVHRTSEGNRIQSPQLGARFAVLEVPGPAAAHAPIMGKSAGHVATRLCASASLAQAQPLEARWASRA